MIQQKNNRQTLISLALVALMLAVVLVLDQVIQPTDYMSMLLKVLQKASVYALAAVSLNLLTGFTGLFSLGHAGFMLIGTYIYAIFTISSDSRDAVYQYYDAAVRFSIPEALSGALGPFGTVLGVIVAVLLAGLGAALVAWLIGLPVLRLKSDYLAIATLGFAEVIRAVFQWGKLGPVTNGSNPLKSFIRIADFKIQAGGVTISLSTFIPVLMSTVCIGIIVLLINSSYGRAFKAIRENEIAAEAMGINLARHKMLSFCISSFFAGVAGAGMAMVLGIAQANNFKSAMTYEILLMVVLGGIGSISGSVIGATLFIAASEWWLRGLDNGAFLGIEAPGIFRNGFRLVVFSVIIMVVVLFFRKGIMGDKELPDLFKRRKKAKGVAK
ncbi:branched-chain amino acid ABC transporter permease [Muriventricola aceti]|uniref:branched-chain amino acid ABC transporter permease n=1 Tax=Muriventricola aceti TaxID=2981773 RepID=UPI000822AEC1|nr:branched-chain amino acid ABC transporter permease [Muriventricola aceti]MCU6701528.1 branched-chain amino acid ABC transporter permease [Muriventricola aceti]SCI63801.1 leucine/isoleucine/valine transporter permease subunit [uncultured Flavonifractor sp.]